MEEDYNKKLKNENNENNYFNNTMSLEDLQESVNRKIPMNYSRIEKTAKINCRTTFKDEDENELILFELPKDFDKTLLPKVKIKNFGKSGKITNFVGNYRGINFDGTHPITSQTLGMFTKKNKKSFIFKRMDRYVKIFEDVEDIIASPKVENVIPRRLVLKKTLNYNKRKKLI
jgi:hypothetical protein